MALLPAVAVILSVFAADSMEASPSAASQGVEESLRPLKMEWESIFNSQLHASSTTCRDEDLFPNSTAGCWEVEFQGNSRAYVLNAEEEMYYHENEVSNLI